MKIMKPLTLAFGLLFMLCACTSLWRGTVTVGDVVDSASKEYAILYKKGEITPALDARIEEAHTKYRTASAIARDALKEYKLTGEGNYDAALEAARHAAMGFIDLIIPLIKPAKAAQLSTAIEKAHTL